MPPIFDKNDAVFEFPYQIHHGEKKAPELACPRCGHMQPRRKRVVCRGCNHLIPTEQPRQEWGIPNLTNRYRDMAQLFFNDPEKTGKQFRRAKGSFGWKVAIRNLVATLTLAAVMVVPSVLCMKAYLGEKDWKKVEDKFNATIGRNFHRVNLTGGEKLVASSKTSNGRAISGQKERRRGKRG